jgi:transcriptional regulator with XRE-family HTH domain
MAEHVGIDRSFISDLENGRKEICIRNLEVLATAFGMTISRLMSRLWKLETLLCAKAIGIPRRYYCARSYALGVQFAPQQSDGFIFRFELLPLWPFESGYKYQWRQPPHEEKRPDYIGPNYHIVVVPASPSTIHRPDKSQLQRVVPTQLLSLANNQNELTPRREDCLRTTHQVPSRLGLLALRALQHDLSELEIHQGTPDSS